MSGLSTIATRSAFRIKRPVIATNGFDSGTDGYYDRCVDWISRSNATTTATAAPQPSCDTRRLASSLCSRTRFVQQTRS